jgi:hypothetical protein
LVGQYRQESGADSVISRRAGDSRRLDRPLPERLSQYVRRSFRGLGRNAIARDEDHARDFLARHQDKLLFGSDCSDAQAGSERCIGVPTLRLLRKLIDDARALKKILHDNAKKIMRV